MHLFPSGLAALVLGLCVLGPVAAEAYRPSSDGEVLEQLPTPGPERRELRRLREALKAAPNRRDLALALARCYIQLGRGNADPRYYGHAEAVLAPWLASPNPDPETLVLRATVLQNRHAFQPALADLDAALRQNPRLAQAWLSRAAILEVQGDYPGALRACLAVARAAASLAGAVCLESALSLSGQAESAYQRLSARVAVARANPDELAWARLILGELAERLGRSATAESWYRMAARTDTRSIYLLSTYADFLLDRDRPEEVVELLEGETRADPLLLRLTLAERRLNHPRHAEHLAALRARFEASRARGDTSHQGDEARYALYLAGDAELALRLASANWAVQREPRDARILLEAAREAGRPEAGRAVAEFLARTRLEDVRLQNLLSRGGGPHS
jgi:Tfp pilus assembly protein PilF